ncbi:MAG: ATP synthase F1 subunit delta [Verrucomicrobia bacterium 61-8]|nr:ATP synthase F1 subunit delta [Verrucomicrobiota bacterium]OJV04051.1 MAG: ATP synthase F1 subunit delta [Verrucomicrobia bacterium 61-8]
MKISREARRAAREMFRLSLVDGRLNTARVKDISDRLVTEKPRSFLEILKEYTRLVRLELAKRHAVIESALALSEDESSRILADLKTRFGNDITAELRVQPDLLAGIRVKVGSDVWDGSVRNRLNTLSQQL